jgi:hypothetical protein
LKAKTIKGKSPAEIQAAIDESKLDQFEPTLAIITLTNIENTEALRSIFDRNGQEVLSIFPPLKELSGI